jgi:hypothetical protein
VEDGGGQALCEREKFIPAALFRNHSKGMRYINKTLQKL